LAIAAHDPQLLVLGGYLFQDHPRIVQGFRRVLGQYVMDWKRRKVEVEVAQLASEDRALGGAAEMCQRYWASPVSVIQGAVPDGWQAKIDNNNPDFGGLFGNLRVTDAASRWGDDTPAGKYLEQDTSGVASDAASIAMFNTVALLVAGIPQCTWKVSFPSVADVRFSVGLVFASSADSLVAASDPGTAHIAIQYDSSRDAGIVQVTRSPAAAGRVLDSTGVADTAFQNPVYITIAYLNDTTVMAEIRAADWETVLFRQVYNTSIPDNTRALAIFSGVEDISTGSVKQIRQFRCAGGTLGG